MEVVTTIFPYTAWPVPWIHNAFENAAATISGVESAYKALLRKGKISGNKKIKFIAFGGDGGTYDIGLQSLSGAIERGHNFLYVLYDNEGYMNTGIQRSSATPFAAHTTTSPAGKVIPGKTQHRKDLTEIVAAHNLPYAPCVPGWGYPEHMSIELAKLAVETKFWPLYEVENGYYKINYKPRNPLPVIEFLKPQARFKHILNRPDLIEEIQRFVDERWERLLWLEQRKPEENK